MRSSLVLTAVVAVASLGCGGLMGYGKEVGSTPVMNGAPFTVSYTAGNDQPHQLWLDYDLALSGDWKVTGSVDATAAGAPAGHWDLDFTDSGAPIVGQGSRDTLNSVESNINGSGSARGTIWLTALPAQPKGTTVDLAGTFTGGPQTAINSMRLVVTE